MSDQNVREIQLGGKQLVFLFMASVVLAVAIFLLGISVGRGVGNASGEVASGTDVPVTAEPAPAEMPPATQTTPADLSYHDQLQGQTPPPAESTSKPGAAPAPPVVAPPTLASGPASAPAAPASDLSTTAKPAASPPTNATGFFVQVAAYRSRENADRQAAQLKAKGYAATVLSDAGSLFRVRIGPFQQRDEADRTVQRLQREERIKASVQR